MSLNSEKCLKLMLYIIIIETILGGAGRLLVVHNLSLRMLLYGITFILLLVNLFVKRKNGFIKHFTIELKIISIFAVYLIFTAINGYVFSGNSLRQIIGDLTGYIGFAMILIFAYILDTKIEIEFVFKLISICTIIQAVIILLLHYLLGMGLLEFNSLNNLLQSLYLGNLSYVANNSIRIFLKSSIYLQIGFIFVLDLILKAKTIKTKWVYTISLIVVGYALILSFTRGFWISTFLVLFAYFILNISKELMKTIGYLVIGLVIMFGISILVYGNSNILYSTMLRTGVQLNNKVAIVKKDNKPIGNSSTDTKAVDLSVEYRSKLKNEMIIYIKKSPIIGNGFGVVLKEIGQTESRCEYMFLDIFMEMGILGLFLYLSILISIFVKWIEIKVKIRGRMENNNLDAIILSLGGVILTSYLNPFLNNPLGIIYLLFVICSINFYRKEYIND